MSGASLRLGAIGALVAVQAAIALYIGLPGQLSTDSVIQLYEGRTLHLISFNPPMMSLLLGVADRVGDAPATFVIVSVALLSGSTWLVARRAADAPAWRIALAALLLLNPVMLVYAGIVWKDVLLAHAVVFVYLWIAYRRERGKGLGAGIAIALLVLLAVIAGVRQQGLLFSIPAALWAATLAKRPRGRIAAAIVFVALPIAADRALQLAVDRLPQNRSVDPVGTGVRILQQFDVAGTLANGGSLPDTTPPDLARELYAQALRYSPYRVDTLTSSTERYWKLSNAEARALWTGTVAANPRAYLLHRWQHFRAFLGFDDMRECLPIHTGIAGPLMSPAVGEDLAKFLGLNVGPTHSTPIVWEFAMRWQDTPLFMHFTSLVVLVPALFALALRREYVLVTLGACSLLLLASQLVIGIACDFRYAYPLTVSASLLGACALLAPARRHQSFRSAEVIA